MSKKFVTVSRKQCCHCGKLFITERHDCKFDPEKRNCLTCQHNLGHRDDGEGDDYFECEAGYDGGSNLGDIISAKWNLNCPKWQLVEGCDKAKNVREAKGNQFRRIIAEEAKKETEAWMKVGVL